MMAPMMKDSTMSSSSRAKPVWWKEVLYAETLCGVAQVVRDPGIPREKKLSVKDRFISMPSPFGAFNFSQPIKKLPKPKADEMDIIPMAEQLAHEES